jgi:ribonuclease P protein component
MLKSKIFAIFRGKRIVGAVFFDIWMNNETHLSTEQTPSQESPRLPQPHEDSKWPQDHQAPPPSRPQSSRRLSSSRLTFPKSLKLKKRIEFKKIQSRGQRLVGTRICMDWRATSREETRLGITASKRYGKAHERNRFKRLVREAFRLSQDKLPGFLDINVVPRAFSKNSSLFAIQSELIGLLKKCRQSSSGTDAKI